jgi:hypothetical protein
VFSVVSDVEPPRAFAPPAPPTPTEPPPFASPVDGATAFAPSPDEPPSPGRTPRPGELTPAWRIAVVITWVGALLAYLAVWKASEEVGIATWWLGPRSHPEPMYIRLLPFAIVAVFGILASYNTRRLPWISLAGSGALALIAVPDLSRSGGLAAIEFTIAGAVALVSLGSLTGMYRAAAPDADR